MSVKFSSTGFEFPFRHCSVSTSWSPKCCLLPFSLSFNPHKLNRLSRLIYRCGSYAASSAKRSKCLHGWKRARGRMQEGSTPSAVDLSIRNGKVKPKPFHVTKVGTPRSFVKALSLCQKL